MRRKLGLVLLVSFIALGGISIQASSEPNGKYIGTDNCKVCHMKQYRSWAQTKMAKTFTESLNAEQRQDPECIVCHVTGYKKLGGFFNQKDTPHMVGVQCEGCHGPGSMYYTDEVMRNKKASLYLGLLEQTEKVCIVCHNEKSPTFPGPFKFDKSKGVHEHFPLTDWFKKLSDH